MGGFDDLEDPFSSEAVYIDSPFVCVTPTRGQQDNGGDDQRADDQDDQQGDCYSLPVPLGRRAAHQVLKHNRNEPSLQTWKHKNTNFQAALYINPIWNDFHLQADVSCCIDYAPARPQSQRLWIHVITHKTDVFCTFTAGGRDRRQNGSFLWQTDAYNSAAFVQQVCNQGATPRCLHTKSPRSFAW